ncbi:MAG: hypothetical protein CL910_08280 [Deltaproteobacteria bacterium]|jgi:class 3 adenylate cyclase/CheY-like chemotaxis protein|nr:hypothetical protein [Deltaproteobacteria bacterium]
MPALRTREPRRRHLLRGLRPGSAAILWRLRAAPRARRPLLHWLRHARGRERAERRDPRAPRLHAPHLAERILRSRSALEGERKQVTILFADVKGSTSLAGALDPEAWHQILDGFFQVLAEGVHRFEGTVNQYTGDGIMALFGAPLAHEDHALRACWAARWLREPLRRHADEVRREHGQSFSVRIGIHSGKVVVGKIGDDLHWIDAESESFLTSIIPTVSATRTLVLTNLRPEYEAPWRTRPDYQQIPLSPLGRAIVRRLSEVLGHELDLDSEPGRGSVFSVTLELGREPTARAQTPAPQARGLVGRRIWIVDDDREVRESLVALLATWGADVSGFASAPPALDANATPPDALLVDLELAGRSGLEVVDALPGVPTCIVSGASQGALAPARERGLLVLRKPVEPVQLRAAIEHLLGR